MEKHLGGVVVAPSNRHPDTTEPEPRPLWRGVHATPTIYQTSPWAQPSPPRLLDSLTKDTNLVDGIYSGVMSDSAVVDALDGTTA